MIITASTIFRYDLPLVAPLFVKGHTLAVRSGLLLKLEDEHGNAGWGEIAPLLGMSRETLAQAQEQILAVCEQIAGTGIVADLFTPTNTTPLVPRLSDCAPSVRWGVEQAVWNLYAAQRGAPLHHLLADQPREQILVNGLLAGSADEILAQAARMRRESYRAVKLKVGRSLLADEIALTQRVRAALGDEIALRLDANRAWDWHTALRFARAVADLNIAYIEEPLADAQQLPQFIQQSPVPVALDETLSEGRGARDAERGASTLILKPALLGGMGTTLQWVRAAQRIGAVAVFSSLFESGLTITTLAQLAATLPENVPTGLDTYRWLREDVLAQPLSMHGGVLPLGDVQVNEQMLQRIA